MSFPYYDDPDLPNWLPDKFNVSDDFSPLNISYGQVATIWGRAPDLEVALKSLLVFLICAIGLLGNFLVIFLVLRQPKIRQQPVNIYIVNLAIADFMTIIFTPCIALVNNIYQNYELGPVMCKLEILIKMMCILASIFSVVAISFQRFLNINSPMSGQVTKTSHPRTLLVIIIIWIVSIVLAMPLAIWRTYQERQWKDYLEKWCTDYPAEYSIRYWIFLISPLIYIPLIVMVIMYWLMIVKINRFIRKLQKKTGISVKDANSYNSNHSNNSSFRNVYELKSIQEAHKKKMQAARKKQIRSKTEPSDSLGRQSENSYFSEIDDLQLYGRGSRSSSISATFTSSSFNQREIVKNTSYFNGTITSPTYLHYHKPNLHHHPHHPLQTSINVEKSSKNLQNHSENLNLPLPIPLPLISRSNFNEISKKSSIDKTVTESSLTENGTSNGHSHNHHQNEHFYQINKSRDQTDGVGKLTQLAANRQVMSANLYKRSVMFTIIVFCLITFIFWLPLQVLVYYRALKPKVLTMACWYENIKFVAQILCGINSAINPFVTFRRTFSQIYQQFRARQKQSQLRKRLKRNHLKMNAPNQGSNRKPKPSLETFNLTPVVHVIEVVQHQQKQQSKTKNALQSKPQVKIDIEPKNSPRRRKISKSLEMDFVRTSSVSKDFSSHIQPISPISNSSSSSDPLASYLAEQSSDVIETPSPEVTPLPVTIFTSKLTATEDSTQKSEQKSLDVKNDKESNLDENQKSNKTLPSATYTHKLTKKMLMKYTPERFADK